MQFTLIFIKNYDHELSRPSCMFYGDVELSFNDDSKERTNDGEIFSHLLMNL